MSNINVRRNWARPYAVEGHRFGMIRVRMLRCKASVLAEKLGITPQTISAYETGRRSAPFTYVARLRNIAVRVAGREWDDSLIFEDYDGI